MLALLDANRDRVIARNILPFVISQLQTEPWLVIPVLNNIVADYGGNLTLLVLCNYESSWSYRARTRVCEKTWSLCTIDQLIAYISRPTRRYWWSPAWYLRTVGHCH